MLAVTTACVGVRTPYAGLVFFFLFCFFERIYVFHAKLTGQNKCWSDF